MREKSATFHEDDPNFNFSHFACFYDTSLEDKVGYVGRFLNIFEDTIMRPENSDWISKLTSSSGVSVNSFVRYWRAEKEIVREKARMREKNSRAIMKEKAIRRKTREPSLSLGEPTNVSASPEIEEMIPQQSPIRSIEIPIEAEKESMEPKESKRPKILDTVEALSGIHHVLMAEYDMSNRHPLWAQQTLDKIQVIINKTKE